MTAPRPSSQSLPPQRQRIVERAMELLALHGFEASTMRQIGDAVGLDNSSLYRHFKSKAELVNAVIDQVAAQLLLLVETHPALQGPMTLEKLEDVSADLGGFLLENRAAARLLMHWLMASGDPDGPFPLHVSSRDVSRPHGRLLTLLLSKLDEGAKSGDLRKAAMPDAIVGFLGLILLRPATYGSLLHSLEPKRSHAAAIRSWEKELRAFIRGAFAR